MHIIKYSAQWLFFTPMKPRTPWEMISCFQKKIKSNEKKLELSFTRDAELFLVQNIIQSKKTNIRGRAVEFTNVKFSQQHPPSPTPPRDWDWNSWIKECLPPEELDGKML